MELSRSGHTMRILRSAAFLSLFALAGSAQAISFTNVVNASIADNAGDTNPVLTTIDTTGSFGLGWQVASVSLELVLNHTWVGDLAIELWSPSGTEIQLMARPGSTIGDEQRGSPWGDSSNLRVTDPIRFLDSAVVSAETMGSTVNGNRTVPAGAFRPDADGWTTDITTLAGFLGEQAGGLWTLRVGDYGGGDVGTLVQWNLDVTAVFVPEPAPALMLGLGCLGLAVGGRRRAAVSAAA